MPFSRHFLFFTERLRVSPLKILTKGSAFGNRKPLKRLDLNFMFLGINYIYEFAALAFSALYSRTLTIMSIVIVTTKSRVDNAFIVGEILLLSIV